MNEGHMILIKCLIDPNKYDPTEILSHCLIHLQLHLLIYDEYYLKKS